MRLGSNHAPQPKVKVCLNTLFAIDSELRLLSVDDVEGAVRKFETDKYSGD